MAVIISQNREKTESRKILKLFFLIFPLITIGQNKFNLKIEKLKQNNKYENVYAFEINYAVFRTFDNKMGVIDSTGNVIIKPVFTYIFDKKDLQTYSK